MNYIILDLEWNQGYPGAKVFIGDTRKQLAGEIIQIGAVKLNEEFQVIDTYSRLVKPVFYRKMHFKIEELTGITKDQLKDASPFTEVFPDFLSWCGEEHEYLIWGTDDIAMLKQNIDVNKIVGVTLHDWYNIQIVYNTQYKSEHQQVALSTACETLGISQDKQLHNAFNDALYTAQVCAAMDMKSGLALCKEKQKNQEQNVKRKFRYYDFGTPRDAFEFTSSCDNQCPLCGKTLILKTEYYRKYYNQFSAVRECEEHGCFCENIIVAKINEKLVNSKFKSVKTLHRAANFETAMRLVKVKKRRRQNRQKPAGNINE